MDTPHRGRPAAGHWSTDDIPWTRFEPGKVDRDILPIVKAAAMVKSDRRRDASRLGTVFPDDPLLQRAARDWAEEEALHGEALGRWAALADPGFDYDAALERYRDRLRQRPDAHAQARISRTAALVARCMAEVGTGSHHTALADASDEPVLCAICRRIAQDEFRHYRIFYKGLKRHLDEERLRLPRRLGIALGGLMETEDEDLAYAYYAANAPAGPYEHATYAGAYFRRAHALYRPRHMERAMGMVFKAVGLDPHGPLSRTMVRSASWMIARRQRRLARAA